MPRSTLISATEVNVKGRKLWASSDRAQVRLAAANGGCVNTGKPDSNDWVRAQGQLYPQVLNLIQELHAGAGAVKELLIAYNNTWFDLPKAVKEIPAD